MSYKIYKNNQQYRLRYANGGLFTNNSDIIFPITPTPTITPSSTATPIISVTTTPQASETVTITPTPTATTTPETTTTPTVSVSPTITVTPTTSVTATITTTPTPSAAVSYLKTSNTANYNSCADWDSLDGNVTSVGSNGNQSAYGVYDMNGNSWEWTERLWNAGTRGVKGGSWNSLDSRLLRTFEGIQDPNTISNQIGFRIASTQESPLFEYSTVSDPNNMNDDSGIGAVSYQYKVAKFLVTNNQYVEFLNSVAQTDAYGLYNSSMSSSRGGINRSGSSGSYSYSVKTNYENKPAIYITWYNATRYCNWLHNDKPNGSQNNSTTENGAYQLTGNTGSPSRAFSASYFLMSGDEWQKAAFYKGGSSNSGYWNYATQNDTVPTCIPSDSTGNGTN